MIGRNRISVILFLIMMLVIASCTSKPIPASTSQPSTSADIVKIINLQGYKGPDLSKDQVTLRLIRQVYGDTQEAYWKDVYKRWNEAYPNIKIQEETVPFGQLFTKVQTSAASGAPPDIMMGQGDFTKSYVYSNMALPLNQYLTEEYMNDLMPAFREMATTDGNLYLFPYEMQVSVMVYNRDVFKAANIEEPPQSEDPTDTWTWEKWIEVMRAVRDYSEKNEISMWALAPSEFGAGGPGSNYWHEGILIRSFGDPNAPKESTAYKTWAGISEDGLTASGYVDTPEAIEAMRLYQLLFSEKLSPTAAMSNAWMDQKAAIEWIAGQWWTFDPPFEAGYAPNPLGKTQFTHISGDAPFISSKTKYPAEAAAFLCFLMNDENRIRWDEIWGSIPVRQSVIDQISRFKEWPNNTWMEEVRRFGSPAPKTPGILEYQTAMNQAIRDIALGADPGERLHKVAKEIDVILSKYK